MNIRLILLIVVGVVSLLLASNFTVYQVGDFDSLRDEVVVCDINWLQKPINCKPVFPAGFDFDTGTDSITRESNWP